jgi:glucose-1-phosphate cytidylyltransferase
MIYFFMAIMLIAMRNLSSFLIGRRLVNGNKTCVVLCGGKALRLGRAFDGLPKPLVEVNSSALLSFILGRYRLYGVCRFLLLVGSEQISYFSAFAERYSVQQGVSVEVVETGGDTPTGGRIKLAEPFLKENDFFVTYGDGVADIAIDSLLEKHLYYGCPVTLTAVQPRLPFGLLAFDQSGNISAFDEKPIMNHYINGGFMVFNSSIFDRLSLSTDLEAELLPALAAAGALAAYKHYGFWKCMDTLKDVVELNSINLSEKLGLS